MVFVCCDLMVDCDAMITMYVTMKTRRLPLHLERPS
jgi:hypothetical protein